MARAGVEAVSKQRMQYRGLRGWLEQVDKMGELRKVDVRYRCSVCGAEVKMTLAAEEDPPPPRHCMEDMEIVAPIL